MSIATKLVLIAALAASPLAAQVPAVTATAVNPGESAEVLAAERLFSAWLEGQIAYRGLPGVAVGVVSDQKLVWSKGFGFADTAARVPMTAQTKFRMASNSKLFAAVAIMQLREAGKVGLDDPVEKYLPWFKAKPAGADDGPITVEQLLSHSSGLQREAGGHWSSFEFPTMAELQKEFSERQAAFAPSVRWKYSNLAYAVAGSLVETISGQGFAAYVQANIFDPLTMRDSSFDKPVAGLATPYGPRLPDGSRAVMPFIDARGMAAATGLTSNVDDMARFMSAQFRRGPRGGAQIVSSGSWREMLRVRSVEEDWESGSGLGFDIERVKGRTYAGHGGGYPGNTTMTMIQLDDKVGVIVLTNTTDSNPTAIANQLMATVGQAVAKAAMVKPAVVAWNPAWSRFAGLYRSPQGSTSQVVLLDNRLVLMTPNAVNLDNIITLTPIGDGRFRFVAPGGGGPVGEIVRFTEETGKPMRMYTGDSWTDRIPAL